MTIEVTGEMVQLIYDRIDFWDHGPSGIREGLAAVLAIVERDRALARPADLRTVLLQNQVHAHRVPGVWDGNGARCQECAARSRLWEALP